ncbi:uncharacterized protein PV09_05898 [Verruconis gallopava]|uniref:Superkiller protein 3 n=1 Tax=Verruconis gallopava TaxID=253628 RepID=A0A0D1XKI4_9PEZI|nr:uncharacterized protein PV09_05898 [Verruconis gallopava]KIW02841.1 hypothetical protein PV09_05898 [Verruconis gallopava]
MASTKAALKAAKAAIDAKDWDTAIAQAQTVLASDPKNYFAKLFLGRAYDKQGKVAESAKAYEDATELQPNDERAWIGLQSLYESQGGPGIDGYIWASWNLAKVYAAQDNKHKCQSVVDKLVGVGKNRGTRAQYKKALAIQLPTGPIYNFLEGRLPHPSHTYMRLAEVTEAEEKAIEKSEVETRRTRIGARKEQVIAEVKREIYAQSDLEELYQGVIDWTEDDGTRRKYEEKLLQRAYDTLLVLPEDQKPKKREEVLKQAHGMVIIKHACLLAWNIELEWTDVENISEMDSSTLYEYTNFFPESGLSKVLKGYLNSSISPFPNPPAQQQVAETGTDDDDDTGGGVSLMPTGAEEVLLSMADGLAEAKNSALAHRLVGQYYNHLEEYETSVDTLRAGLKVLANESKKSGLKLQNNADAMNTMLATALVHHQSPRFHSEARALFEDILARKPFFTEALIGVGLVLEEDEEYAEAIEYLSRALERDSTNARVGAELAWCRALNGDTEMGLAELKACLAMMKPDAKDMRAETLYRIGKCEWDLDPSRASRKDRKGPYAQFLASIKANVNYAPSYTMLGIYYSDYARDRKRARQCFQKAFELSASEIVAAERLARSFADQGDWDIVALIAQRVIDSGKTRPPPGSKKKGISWPYSALGVVQMNRLEYQAAIVSFLAALRIDPTAYHGYVGLGESYHNSGRYNSAARTFEYAEKLLADSGAASKSEEKWFTGYMLANVNRELGAYDKAIEGYKDVLDARKREFGVEIALLQTYLERAWRNIETGYFGGAIDSTELALKVAAGIAEYMPNAFNLWKAIADACAVFSVVQTGLDRMPKEEVRKLLVKSFEKDKYNFFAENDGVNLDLLDSIGKNDEHADSTTSNMSYCLTASILAQKRAIMCCAHDQHAQAVSWYNLGWAEFRAHACLDEPTQLKTTKSRSKYLKASMRCFKRAIELEAGNSEFWNALGVVTTKLNPKVAQHSFVRSLHLNERNVKAWTNLGVLYFLQNDFELAHTAFARAQSTDPDYAHAWVGEGLVALIWGKVHEALLHFKHAFEISDSGLVIVKKEFAAHTFDQLMTEPERLRGDTLQMIQPLFALQQLSVLNVGNQPYELLSALYNERVGRHVPAIDTLTQLCEKLEAEYERTESPSTLARFAQAKVDLARNHLAAHDYERSSEEANLALALTSEDDTVSPEMLGKIHLSAQLTLGLASYYLKDMDTALEAFRKALQNSKAEPDVVCMLAEVLWARGGDNERSVAKEQLFDTIERQPGHVNSVILLGAMSAVEEDMDTINAAREELETLRVTEGLSQHDLTRIERVLEAMAQICPKHHGNSELEMLNECQEMIMLYPWKATGWRRLALESEDAYAKEMALAVASNNVPPKGPLTSEELCEASAQAGTLGDAQRAIFMAPWKREGWEALLDGINVES